MKKYVKRRIYASVGLVVVVGLLFSLFPGMIGHSHDRAGFISLRENIQEGMREQEGYRCCLEKPCTYCIEKTPEHGEGASCDCLSDVVNGRHPCGECIGEILEGHGNPYLSKYFANAIADELGDEYMETLQKIIYDKYGTPVEEQYVF